MEILILIGIFAFVIAILFRSNEALDRVDAVEKEVKTIEEEIGHTEAPQSLEVPAAIPVTEAQSELEAVSKPEETPAEATFPKQENVHMNR